MVEKMPEEEQALTPEAAQEAVSLFKHQKGNPFEWDWLRGIWDWLKMIWSKLMSLATEAAMAVWNWIKDFLISTWNMVYSLGSQVARLFSHIFSTVSDVVSSWVSKVWGWIQEVISRMGDFFTSLGASVWGWIQGAVAATREGFTSLGMSIANYFTELPKTIERTFIDPITDWFRGFISTLASIGTTIWEPIKTWFRNLPEDLYRNFVTERIQAWAWAFHWVGDWAEAACNNVLKAIIDYVGKVGRVDPTNAPSVAGALMSLVGTGVFALSAMTLAGELMHPLKEIGMGHISAMIGDVINYKVISGAFMGALVGAALSTPLRYYFNYALRPWLPDRRVIDGAMSRSMFTDPEHLDPELAPGIKALVGPDGGIAFERRMLGYHGFADEWYPVYKELASTKIGYFALAAVATGGTYDDEIFRSEMMRAGYWGRARELLLDMYRRTALGEIKALYIGDPISAFKEGWFSEERLARELIECGIPRDAVPRYLHAAWIKYEVDLLSDRLAGLKEAYRKGLVTDEEFRGSLTGWGMASERAEEHLSREQIRRYGKL